MRKRQVFVKVLRKSLEVDVSRVKQLEERRAGLGSNVASGDGDRFQTDFATRPRRVDGVFSPSSRAAWAIVWGVACSLSSSIFRALEMS